MNHQPKQVAGVPYKNLASGIAHGPYAAAPAEIIDLYLTRHYDHPELEPTVSPDQKRADVESEWQYDQHAEAVMTAFAAGRISQLHALYMLERVLRPWFVGRRNPGE